MMNKIMWVKGFEKASEDNRKFGSACVLHNYALMLNESGIDKDFQRGYRDYIGLVIE